MEARCLGPGELRLSAEMSDVKWIIRYHPSTLEHFNNVMHIPFASYAIPKNPFLPICL